LSKKSVCDFEENWIQNEIENAGEDYPEIKETYVQRKIEVSDCILQFKSRVDEDEVEFKIK